LWAMRLRAVRLRHSHTCTYGVRKQAHSSKSAKSAQVTTETHARTHACTHACRQA
jgi:hypothetical protein